MQANANRSEVARILARIAQEYEVMQRGLSGFALGSARHAFIQTRMENMGQLGMELEKYMPKDRAWTYIGDCYTEAVEGKPLS